MMEESDLTHPHLKDKAQEVQWFAGVPSGVAVAPGSEWATD